MFSIPALLAILIWLAAFSVVMAVQRTAAALAGGMVFGVLFLPQFQIDIPFLPLTKLRVVVLASTAGLFLIDRPFRTGVRFSQLDLPMLALCCSGMAASLSNGLGIYDGAASSTSLCCTWGFPYLLGRIAFSSQKNATALFRMTIIGALFYVPFCLFEMRLSPVLHLSVYGYTPRVVSNFVSAVRYGFYRPTVFFEHGLQLSLFMGIASVVARWGAVSGQIPTIGRIATSRVATALAITTFFCVSTGAILLTLLGWSLIALGRLKLARIVMITLILIPIGYPIFRMISSDSITVTGFDVGVFSQRLTSLQFRINNEHLFLEHWRERPVLGWSPWHFKDVGASKVVADALWIQILTMFGLLGWGSMVAAQAWPSLKMCAKFKKDGSLQTAAYAMSVAVVLFMLDCMANGLENPIYIVFAGAIVAQFDQELPQASLQMPVAAPVRGRRSRHFWPQRLELQRGL